MTAVERIVQNIDGITARSEIYVKLLCVGSWCGQGVYFATSFALSARYATPTSSGYQHVFQCRVLTGQFALGNPTIVEPPVRDKSRLVLYDSVVDTVEEPRMFVVFSDAQAYPEYLITFK